MTGGEGARELLAKISVTVSLRRPDIRNDVLGGDPAGEAAVETGRRSALDEPVVRASCEINVFSPGNAGGGRAGGTVSLSACQLPVRKVPGWRASGLPPGS